MYFLIKNVHFQVFNKLNQLIPDSRVEAFCLDFESGMCVYLTAGSTATSRPLRQLMNYLSTTWLNSTVWSVQQWSVFRQSVRTNNDVEGMYLNSNFFK